MTQGAARALGMRDLGSIAPNKRADLCFYDKPASWSEHESSVAFVNLLASAKPRHVFIDGMAEIFNGALTDALMVESAA